MRGRCHFYVLVGHVAIDTAEIWLISLATARLTVDITSGAPLVPNISSWTTGGPSCGPNPLINSPLWSSNPCRWVAHMIDAQRINILIGHWRLPLHFLSMCTNASACQIIKRSLSFHHAIIQHHLCTKRFPNCLPARHTVQWGTTSTLSFLHGRLESVYTILSRLEF